MTARTFASVSEAVGYAAAVCLHRGGIRKPKPTHGGPPPDDEAAIRVLQAMREAGCPHDSDEGRSIIAWAKAPDDVQVEVDSSVRAMLSLVLEQVGLVRRPLKYIEIGYRVHRWPDGRRQVMVIPDPHPSDTCVIRASSKSAALASAYIDHETLPCVANRPPIEVVMSEALAAIEAGDIPRDVDAMVASRLRVSTRTARRLRTRWTEGAAVPAAAVGG